MADDTATPPGQCVECKRLFPPGILTEIEHLTVCAECKPVLVKRLLEGQPVRGFVSFAGFGVRLVATLIDGLILAVPASVLLFVVMISLGVIFDGVRRPNPPSDASEALFGLLVLLALVASLMGYEVLFVWKRGATPGKMACGLRVINADGSAQVSPGKAFGRFWAKVLSVFTCMIGFLIVLFDDEKQAAHDHICGTRVVRVR